MKGKFAVSLLRAFHELKIYDDKLKLLTRT